MSAPPTACTRPPWSRPMRAWARAFRLDRLSSSAPGAARQSRRPASACRARARSSHWRGQCAARTRVGARARHARPPRRRAGPRRHRQRRVRLRGRPDGVHDKIPQVGTVVIGDDVEIGANTTIDRPPMGETRIGARDQDRQPGADRPRREHRRARHARVAGRHRRQHDGWRPLVLAGQVGVAGHLTIGKGVRATAQTGIPNSLTRKATSSRAIRPSTTATGSRRRQCSGACRHFAGR